VSTGSGSVVATAGDPFRRVSDAAWIDAGDLAVGELCLRPTVPPDSPWVWFLVFIEGGGCRLEGVVVSVIGGLDLVRSA